MAEAVAQALQQLGEGDRVLVRRRGAGVEGVQRRRAALEAARLEDADARALDGVGDEQLRAVGLGREQIGQRPRNAGMSLPSQRATAQPNAATFASRSPRSLTCSTQVSDWILLWSTMTVISPKPSLAACPSDSQNWPSCSSPSPVTTKTRRRGAPAIRPRARGPWPWRRPSRASRCSSRRRAPSRCRGGPAARPGAAAGAAARSRACRRPRARRTRRARHGPWRRMRRRRRRAPRGAAS